MTDIEGSGTPRFRVEQIVRWGNGVYRYFVVQKINPRHCGACRTYRLSAVTVSARHLVDNPETHTEVSEDVLHPLTAVEIGVGDYR